MIEGLIHLVSLTDNDYLLKRLKQIKETVDNNPNDMELGYEIRKLLN